jgi:hypothetical protein
MARSQTDGRTSLYGRQLMIAEAGNLLANGRNLTRPCVDATVTVNATATSPRTITVQLLDSEGRDIDYVETFEIIAYSSSAMTAFTTTGGSTGLAIGTDGALLAVVAKKYFIATSEDDGDWDGTHTDTGTDAVWFAVRLPNGKVVLADRASTIGT